MNLNPSLSTLDGETIRIAIADGHALFRAGLRKLLDEQPGFEVVGEAADGREVAGLVQSVKPHVLLLELDLPRRSGLETLRDLDSPPGQTRSLLLVSAIKRDQLIEALCVGAYGLVVKSAASQLLFKGIRTVMAGHYWLGRESIGELIRALRERQRNGRGDPRRGAFGLTLRELEIISAIVGGYTNKDIAQRLGMGEVTVKHHLSNIFRKVHVSNRLALALFAVDHRLLSRPEAVTRPQAHASTA